MEKTLTILILLTFLAGPLLFFSVQPHFTTGGVVAEIEENAKINEFVSGNIQIEIEKDDKVEVNTPLSIAIFNDKNEVVASKIMPFEDFVALPDESKNQNYIAEGVYSAQLSNVLNFKFQERGSYEILVAMPKINFIFKKDIIVE